MGNNKDRERQEAQAAAEKAAALVERRKEYQAIAGESGGTSLETATEIERKWKITNLPGGIANQIVQRQLPYEKIEQGYTQNGVRLRMIISHAADGIITGTQYFVSYKTHLSDDGIKRHEEETKIDEEVFKANWNKVNDSIVKKIRYKIPDGQQPERNIDLDFYEDTLIYQNLIVAEVEFNGETAYADAKKYNIPKVFESGRKGPEDITRISWYDNKTLAEMNGERRTSDGKKKKPIEPPAQPAQPKKKGRR